MDVFREYMKNKTKLVKGFYFGHLEDNITGVYVLFNAEREALYVGESTDVKKLFYNHLRDKDFADEVNYFEVYPIEGMHDNAYRRVQEGKFIDLYTPKYNSSNKGKSLFGKMFTVDNFDKEEEKRFNKLKGH
jgi:excinuclease UvrABC nuclease subunit